MNHGRQLAGEEYQSKAGQLQVLRQRVRDCLKKEGCETAFIQRMVLAVNEAGMNIIQHAYNNRSTEKFKVYIYSDDHCLTFRLIDFAPRVDKTTIKSRDLNVIKPGGLGVYFINELMDQVEYLDNLEQGFGNIIQMKKQIEYS